MRIFACHAESRVRNIRAIQIGRWRRNTYIRVRRMTPTAWNRLLRGDDSELHVAGPGTERLGRTVEGLHTVESYSCRSSRVGRGPDHVDVSNVGRDRIGHGEALPDHHRVDHSAVWTVDIGEQPSVAVALLDVQRDSRLRSDRKDRLEERLRGATERPLVLFWSVDEEQPDTLSTAMDRVPVDYSLDHAGGGGRLGGDRAHRQERKSEGSDDHAPRYGPTTRPGSSPFRSTIVTGSASSSRTVKLCASCANPPAGRSGATDRTEENRIRLTQRC